MVTTSEQGCSTPQVISSVTDGSTVLTLERMHDTVEWSTGETTTTIEVEPSSTWYWVKTTGPDSREEAAVALSHHGLLR